MRRTRLRRPLSLPWLTLATLLCATTMAAAQSSASYKLREQVLNAGGHPAQGAILSSSSFHIRLDAIGEAVLGVEMASAGFHADIGFVSAYPPPREVSGLRIAADKKTWSWSPERSVGSYDLYRDMISTLPGSYGTCFQSSIVPNSWVDSSTPPLGKGWFYIATAKNRLGEEGTKGRRSNGVERPNPAPCP